MLKFFRFRPAETNWIAFFLILLLVGIETGLLMSARIEAGRPANATIAPLDIAKLANSLERLRFVQTYDDKIIFDVAAMLRDTGAFADSMKSGVIPDDYVSHKSFYVKAKADLSVLQILLEAEAGGSPVADLMRKSVATLSKTIQDWETLDQMQRKVAPAYINETNNVLKIEISGLIAATYAARSGRTSRAD